MASRTTEPMAAVAGLVATGLLDVTDDVSVLESSGRWFVVVDFEGRTTCARFATWQPGAAADWAGRWRGPDPATYRSNVTEWTYQQAVSEIRSSIARGDVYQANLCRLLRADLTPGESDIVGLSLLLQVGNPAPHGSVIRLPGHGRAVACASPELFLERRGSTIASGPIKGTTEVGRDFADKDVAENIMIVDLVRNDLGRVCVPGSVKADELLVREEHPRVSHLVSRVSGQLTTGVGWPQILDATFPPGSVTGAPKLAALDVISQHEPEPRGPYCGAIGWVDADTQEAVLAVGIRTFSVDNNVLTFGTGAGITWGSDPASEWEETELKSRHLLTVAAGNYDPNDASIHLPTAHPSTTHPGQRPGQ